MAFELSWSDDALTDIEAIANYIEKDSPVYAKAVVSKIFDKAEILSDFPELGRRVPELNQDNIREIFVYSYRLIYAVDNVTIVFLSVLHGKRLIENNTEKRMPDDNAH